MCNHENKNYTSKFYTYSFGEKRRFLNPILRKVLWIKNSKIRHVFQYLLGAIEKTNVCKDCKLLFDYGLVKTSDGVYKELDLLAWESEEKTKETI